MMGRVVFESETGDLRPCAKRKFPEIQKSRNMYGEDERYVKAVCCHKMASVDTKALQSPESYG
jgi:hypothetical protein